ncbi:MAG: transposase, partial [Sphaerochaetaceae bacterium]|nr:transposase [Sphaerochaetaceae bacterium]
GKKYDLKTLKDIENVRFLAVDEIAIHKHHNYATVFMNLENGHIVYCEQGKKKDQVIHILLICICLVFLQELYGPEYVW